MLKKKTSEKIVEETKEEKVKRAFRTTAKKWAKR